MHTLPILPIWWGWYIYIYISSIHRFSHDQTNSQATRRAGAHGGDAVAWGSQRASRTRAHGERFGWLVLSWVFWVWTTKVTDSPDWMSHIATKELVWFFQEVLNLRKIAEQFATLLVFPSSKVVVQVFMMNDGSFSPKVSGLCSCAPILADARHRGWSGIDGCVKKN